MRRFSIVFLAILLAAASLLHTPPATAQPREWPVSSPEEQGMSSEALARLVDFGLFNDMDSLLVTCRGRIVLEATYAPFRAGLKHRINSVTKAVVASLVAIALRDGLLDSTDRRGLDFFPGRRIAALDERKQAITITPPGVAAGTFGGPIGFDGRFRVGGRRPYGPSAARAAWSADGTSPVVEVQTLGDDDAARVTHVFNGKKVEISLEAASGFRSMAQGEAVRL